MINKIINGIWSVLFSLVGGFTQPIVSFLNSVAPDLSTTFNSLLNFLNGLTAVFSWFVYLIPPVTKSVLIVFFYIVASSQSLIIIIKISSWCIDLVKRIWIFGGK